MRVLLATLTPGSVSAHYHESVCDLLENPIPRVEITRLQVRGGPLPSHQRNEAVKYFLKTDSDYLIFVDSDIKFSPGDIQKLLDSRQDIIGARYYGYSEERNDTYPTWKPIDESLQKGLIECSYIGMGCTLITRSALNKLGSKPFGNDVVNGLDAGEDVTFCHRAREAGLKVFVNADARVYHDKSHLV